jgi:hypothetical protein
MATGTIESMVREAAEQCGWDDVAVIELLEDFIAEYADTDEFADFLRARVDEELAGVPEREEGGEEEEL